MMQNFIQRVNVYNSARVLSLCLRTFGVRKRLRLHPQSIREADLKE